MADQVGTDTKSGAQPDDGALTGTTMGGTVAEAGAQPGHYESFHGRPVSWVAVSIIMVAVWTNLGPSPLITVIIVNVLLFVGIFSRIIPSQALISAIPEVTKRGAFNAITASLQQFSGGIASMAAGLIIVQAPGGQLRHFDWIGYIVMTTALISLLLMYLIHKRVPERPGR